MVAELQYPKLIRSFNFAANLDTLLGSYKGSDEVTIGNGKQIPILHIGTKIFTSPIKTFQLKEIFMHLIFCTDNKTLNTNFATNPFNAFLLATATAIKDTCVLIPTQAAPVPPSPDPCVSTLALLPISSSLSTLPSYPLTSSSLPATLSPTSTQPAPDLIQVPSDGNPLTHTTSHCSPIVNHHPMVTCAKNGIIKKNIFLSHTPIEPSTFTQAAKDIHWSLSMEKEFVALLCNNTRQLVLTAPNGNIVDCKWVYKLKHNPDGIIDRYKAKLIAKGFTQTHGLEYFETSSPVVKASTIQIVLTITFSFSWSVRQLDIQNVFLNGDLQEQVFMSQPPGFINPQFLLMFNNSTKPSMVLSRLPGHGSPSSAVHFLARDFKLPVLATLCLSITLQVTSSFYLYMLMIFCSPTLSSALLSRGFQASRADNSVYPSHCKSLSHSTYIYLGDLHYFVGIEVLQTDTTLHLNQHRYVQDLLQRTNMLDSKSAHTPGLLGQTLSKHDGEPLPDATLYKSTIGALQYLTLTRPDILFAVNKACASSWLLLPLYIGLKLRVSYVISRVLLPMAFTCRNLPRWISMPTLMPIGHHVPMTEEAPVATISSLA
ncbi:hypothetical protein AAG906_018718 [Vitis piasezkii]